MEFGSEGGLKEGEEAFIGGLMSLPPTGRVRARVFGESVLFDGVRWTEGREVVVMILNEMTARHVGTDITAVEAAKRILASVSHDWEITEAVCDVWETELSEGAVD